MFRIKLIHHVNVQVADRERTKDWYIKVLGAEFLDRGPALNKRQLQLRVGSSEVHFTERPQPTAVASAHFALEVDDWEAMVARLDELGIKRLRTSAASAGPNVGGTDAHQGFREDTGEHFTYIHDPDGNMIEMVHHPLGMEDTQGKPVGVGHDAAGRHWKQIPGFVEEAYRSANP